MRLPYKPSDVRKCENLTELFVIKTEIKDEMDAIELHRDPSNNNRLPSVLSLDFRILDNLRKDVNERIAELNKVKRNGGLNELKMLSTMAGIMKMARDGADKRVDKDKPALPPEAIKKDTREYKIAEKDLLERAERQRNPNPNPNADGDAAFDALRQIQNHTQGLVYDMETGKLELKDVPTPASDLSNLKAEDIDL